MNLLLKSGADVNISGHDGNALMNAATWDHLECVQLLIDAGADVNFNRSEFSALNRAAFYASHRCVEKLLSAGANVNMQGVRPVLVHAVCNSVDQCREAFERAKMDYKPENYSHMATVN